MADIQTLVEKYVQLRDKKSELDKAHKEKMAKYNNAMQELEARLLDNLNSMGVESARTPNGTAYRTVRSSVKVEDRDAFLDFIRENGEWEFLESRANKTAVESYLEEQEELPPGLSINRQSVVNIRRS